MNRLPQDIEVTLRLPFHRSTARDRIEDKPKPATTRPVIFVRRLLFLKDLLRMLGSLRLVIMQRHAHFNSLKGTFQVFQARGQPAKIFPAQKEDAAMSLNKMHASGQ